MRDIVDTYSIKALFLALLYSNTNIFKHIHSWLRGVPFLSNNISK
jgi:hypothetical protein